MKQEISYLVLQGGGIRCAWQAGFIAAFERTKPIRPRAISAVSASSTVACALVCRRLEFGVECFKAAIAHKRSETFLRRVIRGQRIFPHADIYRNAILRTFDQSAMDTLFMGPDIQILVTRTSANLPKYAGTMTGLTLHALQGCGVRQSCARMHLQFGFRKEFLSVKQCATPADLADLVLASSCTPPFTPFYSLHGRPVLDGGLSESVPLSGLPEKGGTALVLLTSKGAKEKRIPGIVFAEPSQELNINGWDYDAKKIDYLYALGKKDGGTFFEAKVI
ncbi:MAG TPA: patatin-like phospholipase family protein [Candidatus Limnocylindrales bacterium]|nr:patatin-like phospholipase family protein [Candidatus Limnocylindrales bacterium]